MNLCLVMSSIEVPKSVKEARQLFDRLAIASPARRKPTDIGAYCNRRHPIGSDKIVREHVADQKDSVQSALSQEVLTRIWTDDKPACRAQNKPNLVEEMKKVFAKRTLPKESATQLPQVQEQIVGGDAPCIDVSSPSPISSPVIKGQPLTIYTTRSTLV